MTIFHGYSPMAVGNILNQEGYTMRQIKEFYQTLIDQKKLYDDYYVGQPDLDNFRDTNKPGELT